MISVYDVIIESGVKCHNKDGSAIGLTCSQIIPKELKLPKANQNQKYSIKERKTFVRFYKPEAKPLIEEQIIKYFSK